MADYDYRRFEDIPDRTVFADKFGRVYTATVITLQSKGAHFSTGITCSLFDRNRQMPR